MSESAPTWTAFDGHRRIARGTPADVAIAVRDAHARGAAGPVLVFDDTTGRLVDVDTRGSDDEVRARVAVVPAAAGEGAAIGDGPRRRGRPRLGVIAREVTLLPRHWEWLAAQPGGASVVLRRLVEDARRANAPMDVLRRRREAAYHVMHAIAGDLAGFEEASRALFAGDERRFRQHVARWPRDVREHVSALAFAFADTADPIPPTASSPP